MKLVELYLERLDLRIPSMWSASRCWSASPSSTGRGGSDRKNRVSCIMWFQKLVPTRAANLTFYFIENSYLHGTMRSQSERRLDSRYVQAHRNDRQRERTRYYLQYNALLTLGGFSEFSIVASVCYGSLWAIARWQQFVSVAYSIMVKDLRNRWCNS